MRPAQKRQAEELVKLLEQAHDEIRRTAVDKNLAYALDLLAQCQEGAVELGNFIENIEGEKAATIPVLENYCERVYQIHQELEQLTIDTDKAYKKLRKAWIQIENSIHNDIKVRREAVFLPYKASMWDALESVWKAADEDPDCDAYVIPIPYFDKNPDGSFGQMHYEGDQYPKYVPISDYNAYDFEKRHPDVIFIHNPYDNLNLVTSVHPHFYSDNLKKITEKLIYIPYFILDERDLDDDAKIEGMKHYCMTPGVYNADKVIVQSENMRNIYIKVLTKQFGTNSRRVWEDKILGIGSPKIDKVVNTKKEELDIPKKWLEIIQKPDGSWKKIIFYNTSVGALLENSEKMLEKMKDVFRVFKEKRNEVALLWRPHPLIKATISSMRPQLWQEYDKIVTNYIGEGWGIYDDSADMDRAVVLSDAYYGDGSSVARIYKATGKPVIIQNPYSLPKNNYSLAMDNIVECEGHWWFLALKDNCIYRMNKETLEAEMVAEIPWHEGYGCTTPQYGKIVMYKNKVFAIPWAPVRIAVYNIVSRDLHYVEYESDCIDRGMVFSEGIIKGDKLYLIPCAYENIVCIDMNTELVTYVRLNEALNDKGQNHHFAWGSVFCDKDVIYMTMLFENIVIGYNTQSGQTEIYRSNVLENGCSGICGDENDIWLVPRKTDKIIRWRREQRKLIYLDMFPQGYQAGNWSFHKIVLCGQYLYMLPRDANMCIVIDKETDKISCLQFDNFRALAGSYYNRYFRYSNIWKVKNMLYIIGTAQGEIHCLDMDNGHKVQRNPKIQMGNSKEFNGMEERENRFETIQNYINVNKYAKNKEKREKNQMVGKMIWTRMERENYAF